MNIMDTGKIIFVKEKMVNVFITMRGTILEIGLKIIGMDQVNISINTMMRDILEIGNLTRETGEEY